MAAFLGIAGDSATWLALFVLRWREPNLPQPYRAFGYPFLPALVVTGCRPYRRLCPVQSGRQRHFGRYPGRVFAALDCEP